MIVFDLGCTDGHVFEAWFAGSDAYQDQKARGLLCCPVCGATDVDKAVMAPNVAKKGNQRVSAMSAPADITPQPTEVQALLQKMASVQAEMLKSSQWVGTEFASKARAMEAGDIDPAIIHGQTSLDEARELLEDGIAVMPLLLPVVPPEKQN